MTEDTHKILPADVSDIVGTPQVLISYQQQLLATTALHPVVVCEKSRRIGVTWALAADAVLLSAASRKAGGMDNMYIGFNLSMTREFIDTCSSWAKAFSVAADAVEEFVFEDKLSDEDTKSIQAFRIKFASGYEITALSSRPRSLRGRQGRVIIDEAAFHDDLPELMKAAMAMLMWGGRVVITSTHNGADNHFNKIIQDIHAGRLNYKHIKVDLDDALKAGLYKRICLVQSIEWSEEAEKKWRDDLILSYGDAADEELLCIPRKSGGRYLPRELVESRMEDIQVIRYECDKDFVYLPDHERDRIVSDWLHENVKPHLDKMPDLQSYWGQDFARSGDLSVGWPMQVEQNMLRRTPFVLELKNVPFAQQRQIIWFIFDRLPRFSAAAFDARGNGQQLAEETMQRYGGSRIHQIMASPSFYLEAFPPYKAALEDAMTIVPKDADILNDHCIVVLENGIPKIPDKRTKGKDGNQRHGDSVIAAVLAHWATRQEVSEYGYDPVYQKKQNSGTSDDYPSTNRFKNSGSY